MRNKKNGFLTFWCSLVPGAGEMYMGLYKQGISLMILFFGVGTFGEWANLEVLWAILPVVWFFSFFHTHNLRNMPEEEFLKQEDHYYGFEEVDFTKADEFLKRNAKAVAVVLVVFGLCMLAQIFMNMLNPFFDGFFWNLAWRLNHNVTRIILAAAVILGGIKLLKGNWHQTPKEENVVE
ncbi:hypothetical protein [Anaerotignum sp.]|uniref:hypothetical protein n=1 Tax=Anaerotignum sp. TaxID=2039241 RepID=UPI0027149515|nr:hypothetical protein [Anaerotignum sp.]